MWVRYLFLALLSGCGFAVAGEPSASETLHKLQAEVAAGTITNPLAVTEQLLPKVLAWSHVPEDLNSDQHKVIQEMHAVCELTLLLAQLDPRTNLIERLTDLPRRAASWHEKIGTGGWEAERFYRYEAELATLFATRGDLAPLHRHVNRLPDAYPAYMMENLVPALQPLIRFREEPVVAKATSKLFEGEGRWNPLLNLTNGYYRGNTVRAAFVDPGLFALPLWRKQLGRQVEDLTPIGHVRILDHEAIAVQITKSWQESITRKAWRGQLPPPGTLIDFRICDYVAFLLVGQPEMPAFELYWDEAKRDKALEQARRVLKAPVRVP